MREVNRLIFILSTLFLASGCYEIPEAEIPFLPNTIIIERTNMFYREEGEAEYHMLWYVDTWSGEIHIDDRIIGDLQPLDSCQVDADLYADIKELGSIGVKELTADEFLGLCIPEWREQFGALVDDMIIQAPCGSISFFNDPVRARTIMDRIYSKVEEQCYAEIVVD